MLFCKCSERVFQLWAGNVDRLAAVLTQSMVVVWCKNFAQLYLVLKSMPNAVYNAKFFEEFNRAVHRGAVNIAAHLCGKRANAHRAMFDKIMKDCQATLGRAEFCLFKSNFDLLGACFHIYSIKPCDSFAKNKRSVWPQLCPFSAKEIVLILQQRHHMQRGILKPLTNSHKVLRNHV
jgi:hypothetical protein